MESPYPLAQLTSSNLRFLLEYLAADARRNAMPQVAQSASGDSSDRAIEAALPQPEVRKHGCAQ